MANNAFLSDSDYVLPTDAVGVLYNNQIIAEIKSGGQKAIRCKDKIMKDDVIVSFPEGYVQPVGTKEITENGTHDVTENASVTVDVPLPTTYWGEYTNL